jgi:outer membrane protein assembly factor BamA
LNRLFFLFFNLIYFSSAGQSIKLVFNETSNPISLDLKQRIENSISDSVNSFAIKEILYENGFLEANIKTDKSANTISIENGPQYFWEEVKLGNINKEVGQKLNFSEKLFKNQPVNINQVFKWQEKFLRYYENHGYPFAKVKLDTIRINNQFIYATWYAELNKQIFIDSINIISDEPLPKFYLTSYSGIKKGNPYNENAIAQIETRIKEIPFVVSAQPHKVVFTDQKTFLNLYLRKQKASSFNGVAGFLPDENTGEILITGDAKLALQNALGSGEKIKLNWRKLQTNTQDLNAFVNVPYLFNSPVGTELDLKLYRRDTTFAEQNIKLGLQYAINQGNFFKVFIENYASNLISTSIFQDFTTLPPLIDVRKRNYGIGISAFKLNYKFNPRSGYSYNLNASAGTRQVIENINLNPIIYDSLDLKTNQFNLFFDGEYFFPLFKRSTLKIGNQSKWLINNQLFANELLRIGGLNTLRGFDEESITVSAYSIFTTEYRILLEENSFFYFFSDVAFWERNLRTSYDKDLPFGFGTGISFQTKAGIFTVNYALGKQRNNPLDLRVAKIHFGFLSLF